MGVLAYPTALATVQDALVDTINLALGTRITAADLTALAAIPSRGASGSVALRDRTLCYVTSAAAVYKFSQYSTAAAGPSVVVPSDAGTQPGRWLLQSSTILNSAGTVISSVATGYVKRVMLWQGERSESVWKSRILALRPAVVVQFVGETKTPHANQRGALAEKVYHFSLWGISQNLRSDLEGEKGSPLSAEAAADPGVAHLMGDLEYLLDGLNGSEMGVDGLDFLMYGENDPSIEDYDGREFLWTAPLDVRVTVGKEDPARTAVTDVYAQAVDVQLNQQATLDPLNYVINNPGVPTGFGFTKSSGTGTIVLAGTTINVAADSHTYSASSATYRDLKADGTYAYVEGLEDQPPAVTPGALRVSVVITDSTGVVEDRPIAARATPIGGNQQIYP